MVTHRQLICGLGEKRILMVQTINSTFLDNARTEELCGLV